MNCGRLDWKEELSKKWDRGPVGWRLSSGWEESNQTRPVMAGKCPWESVVEERITGLTNQESPYVICKWKIRREQCSYKKKTRRHYTECPLVAMTSREIEKWTQECADLQHGKRWPVTLKAVGSSRDWGRSWRRWVWNKLNLPQKSKFIWYIKMFQK